jgi:hypothetical protein
MLAFEGTDRGAEELRGLFARAHNINLNNLLGGGVGALWGLPLVVVRLLAPVHQWCSAACKRRHFVLAACLSATAALQLARACTSKCKFTQLQRRVLTHSPNCHLLLRLPSQATDADKAFFARRDIDLRRVLMMELEARAEAIICRMLTAGGGALPETLPALDGSVYVTCSLGAAGDHSFLEAGIMPLLTQLGVPMESLGGHLGTIRRYIGDTSKARPDSCLSSPLSRFDCSYDRRLGTAAAELLRLQDSALKRRLNTARAGSAAAAATAASCRRSKHHQSTAAAVATAEAAAVAAAAEVAALRSARKCTKQSARELMTSVLEARCDVKAWATPQPLGAHAADGAGSGFAITAVKTEDG